MSGGPPGRAAATEVPRTYRATRGWLVFICCLGASCIVLGGLGAGYFAFDGTIDNAYVRIGLVGVALALLGGGAWSIAEAWIWRAILHHDAIETIGLWRRRRMRRDDIRDYTILTQAIPPVLAFTHRATGRTALKLPFLLRPDAAFHAWLATIPNRDTVEAEANEARLLAEPALGPSRAMRAQRLARGRGIARALNVAAFLVTGWCVFAPRPYALAVAVAAALPLVALALVASARQLYRLDEGRNDAHPSPAVCLILPGLALALRATLDVVPLDWLPVLLLAVCGGGGFWALAAAIEPAQRKPAAALVTLICGAVYAYGAGMLGNALLDRAPADVYRVPILAKPPPARDGTRTLKLAPWGPRDDAASVNVARDAYDALQPGDAACVQVRPGALRVAWLQVRPCR